MRLPRVKSGLTVATRLYHLYTHTGNHEGASCVAISGDVEQNKKVGFEFIMAMPKCMHTYVHILRHRKLGRMQLPLDAVGKRAE